jgi:uncharacterized membrane protein
MVTTEVPAAATGGGERSWLAAGDVALDAERTATVAFNRYGDARLTLLLERPATRADLEVLADAADTLAHLRLEDLADAEEYAVRHAEVFGLAEPLPPEAFNRASMVEVVAPGGAEVAVPEHLGAVGTPARVVALDGLLPHTAAEAHTGRGRPRERALDAAAAVSGALARAGAWLSRVTRLGASRLGALTLAVVVVGWVAAFVWQTWTVHARFGTYGFDVGIFDQGVWLLSRLQDPFVTVRGLPLFGDHASFILLLVAPLYRVWADPRLLLALQAVSMAVPAVAVYLVGARRLGNPAAALAVAVAYLSYAPMQWAVTWQFHPETLAAGLLAVAVLAADRGNGPLLAGSLALALLCKEDVGLVVAGFGVTMWLTGVAGERLAGGDPRAAAQRVTWGRRTLVAGLGWFLLATFVLLPLINGRGSPHLAINFGITGESLPDAVLAVPRLAGNVVATAAGDTGLSYLLLIFTPLAWLPLAGWRWLAPVAPPILLNLASTHTEQHKITYQYLATSSPFLAFATVAALAGLATSADARRRLLLGPACVLLVVCALATGYRYGPALWAQHPAIGPAPAETAARQEAIAMIPPDASVSAQYHLVTHLAHRRVAYEFPNPFRAVNWGFPGDTHRGGAAVTVDYILVEPDLMSADEGGDRELLEWLRRSGTWRSVYDHDGVLLLERARRAGAGR